MLVDAGCGRRLRGSMFGLLPASLPWGGSKIAPGFQPSFSWSTTNNRATVRRHPVRLAIVHLKPITASTGSAQIERSSLNAGGPLSKPTISWRRRETSGASPNSWRRAVERHVRRRARRDARTQGARRGAGRRPRTARRNGRAVFAVRACGVKGRRGLPPRAGHVVLAARYARAVLAEPARNRRRRLGQRRVFRANFRAPAATMALLLPVRPSGRRRPATRRR